MTATNRPTSRPRRESDFYPTPQWCVHRLVETKIFGSVSKGNRWLEPSAGTGAIIQGCRYAGVCPHWTAVESREECRKPLLDSVWVGDEVYIDDYLQTWTPSSPFDVAIMNPPFRMAEEFVRKALKHSTKVVALLRLSFIGATARAPWLQAHMPDVYVLPNRPSFIGTGERDASEYAWFVWDKGDVGKRAQIQVLNTTSPAERRLYA